MQKQIQVGQKIELKGDYAGMEAIVLRVGYYGCYVTFGNGVENHFVEWKDIDEEHEAGMPREEVLQVAIETITQNRQDSYGNPENNFELIAKMWSAYMGVEIKAEDVAVMMCMLKMARIKTGKKKLDNYVDLAGYAALAYEVAE